MSNFNFGHFVQDNDIHICLFCGYEAKEEFESGSCRSYLSCRCRARLEFIDKLNELRRLTETPMKRAALARAKSDLLSAKRSVDQAARQIACLQEDLNPQRQNQSPPASVKSLLDGW